MNLQGKVRVLVALLLVVSVGSGMGTAKDVFVDMDAPGSNNGTSWTNAYNSLQEAASQAVAGDVIKVAAGIYIPSPGIGMSDPREATFSLKNGITIQGGWAGYGEPKPNHRDTEEYPTILSGDSAGNDVPVDITNLAALETLMTDPLRQDNCYNVVTGSTDTNRTDASAVLEGCTITGGNANNDAIPYIHPLPKMRGGGIFIYRGSPTIRQCIIRENAAQKGGGGINLHEADPNLIDCIIIGNYSFDLGGGMSNFYSAPILTNCTFQSNAIEAQGEGGAISNEESNIQVLSCTFIDNYGGRIGGAIDNYNSNPNIRDSIFEGNYARYKGGAIDYSVSKGDVGQQITRNCVFVENSSTNGGAISHEKTNGLIVNCIFNNNSATTGGAGFHKEATVEYINCTFVGNTANTGAALGADSTNPPASKSSVAVRNSILYEEDTEKSDLLNGVDGTYFFVNYCCMFDRWGTAHLTNSVGLPPMFVDPIGPDGIAGTMDDDLRLSSSSPCIDAGRNTDVPAGITGDFAGRPRFVDIPYVADQGDGTPPIVDMGAHERQLPGPAVPRAHAGPDQVVYAWLDGIADVTLDGSGSSDADGDELLYQWTWRIGNQNFSASGVNPEIELPIGEHVITLVVSDFVRTSAPDQVRIYVLGSFEANLTVSPELIYRNDVRQPYIEITAVLYEIAADEVDMNALLTLIPGNVPAIYQTLFDITQGDVVKTTILAVFDKDAVLDLIPENGGTLLTVYGQLLSGQVFEGTGMVNISGEIIPDVEGPVPNPLLWALPEPERVTRPDDPTNPDLLYLLSGEPYAVLLNPRLDGGIGGWVIVMRAMEALDPLGGIVQYRFDCFEDNSLDRDWSTERLYLTPFVDVNDIPHRTFRVQARNTAGGTTQWTYWQWVHEVDDSPNALRPFPGQWEGVDPVIPTPNPAAPTPNPTQWAPAEPDLAVDTNTAPYALIGTPQASHTTGQWTIVMRAALSVNPAGGPVEYQFDCFENNDLDRDWSIDRLYRTGDIARADLMNYTFRVRARNSAGDVTLWSTWAWVTEVVE